MLQTLAAIRSEIGDALPITLRISGYERVAGGRPSYETAQVAPQLVAAGVDAFHVSGGVIDRLVTGMVNAADDGDALNVGAAAAVKQAVDVPVIAVGRIHDPVRAEQILAEGRADFIAMGRPMLADPELAAKVRAGHVDRIRRCISCENCIDAMEQRFSVDCAVNPRTGRERELAPHPVTHRKRVVVIGGGPGGLEAARVAAERGHRVSLFERNGQLGGALLWASILHPENEPFLRYLRSEIACSTVSVELSHTAHADEIAALDPDAVIVATGATVVVPPIDGDHSPSVHSGPAVNELLASGARPPHGPAASSSSAVTSLSIADSPNSSRPKTDSSPFWKRVAPSRRRSVSNAGPSIWTGSTGWPLRCTSARRCTASPTTGWCSPRMAAPQRELSADSVIIAGQPEADTALFDALTDRLPGTKVHAVGDCTGLGLIRKATEDGARAACSI